MITLEEDYAAWVAYRKARKDKKGGRGADDRSKTGRSKPKEEGRTTNGFKRKTGDSNRRYTCNIEFHYAPQCPNKDSRSGGPSPNKRIAKKPPSQPHSPIAMESTLGIQPSSLAHFDGPKRPPEHSFSRTLEIAGQFDCVHDDSVLVLDTGATANS